MNKKQRKVIGIAAVVCAVMMVFPPFHYVGFKGRSYGSAGYHFVGMGPDYGGKIDFMTLLWQFGAVAVAAGGLVLVAKDKPDG